MPEYLAPGVYFETVEATPAIAAIRTDIAGLVGIAERGPLNDAVRIESWAQFQARFGGFLSNAYLAYAAKAFFENGGQVCYAVRVAAPHVATTTTGAAQPADRRSSLVLAVTGFAAGAIAGMSQTRTTQTSAAPQPADRSASLVNDVSGFPERALVKVSQAGVLSFRRVRARETVLTRLTWNRPLDPVYNLALPIAFEVAHRTGHRVAGIAAGTLTWERPLEAFYDLTQAIQIETGASPARADLLDEAGHATLRITAIEPGAWGNRVTVFVTRSSPTATRTRRVTQPPARTSALVDSVTGLVTGSLVKIFQPGTPGPDFRVVDHVDPARREIVWTPALPAAYNLVAAADLSRPISFETLEFGLSVAVDGQLREIYAGLSLIARNAGHFAPPSVGARSTLIRIEVLPSPSPEQQRLPDSTAANLAGGRVRLEGGLDGTAALQPRDFTGDSGSAQKSGLRTFEDVDEVAVLAIPDILIQPASPVLKDVPEKPPADQCLPGAPPPDADPPPPMLTEPAPHFSLDEVFRVQQALVTHCELLRDRFAILDPPIFPIGTTAGSASEIQSWRHRFDSKFAALYYPWVLVNDPLRLGGETVRAIPPSGQVAGVYARTDLEQGVHYAPANCELRWTQAVAEEVSAVMQEIFNPAGINCIRTFPGRGIRVYGARTVSSDASWRYVNVRRLMSLIEESVEQSLQWTVFEPNNFALRNNIIVVLTGFLESLWQRGALVGRTPDEAFFVRCDSENNPPWLADMGRLLVEVGVAPVIPAEFVIFQIGRTEDTLQIDEARDGDR